MTDHYHDDLAIDALTDHECQCATGRFDPGHLELSATTHAMLAIADAIRATAPNIGRVTTEELAAAEKQGLHMPFVDAIRAYRPNTAQDAPRCPHSHEQAEPGQPDGGKADGAAGGNGQAFRYPTIVPAGPPDPAIFDEMQRRINDALSRKLDYGVLLGVSPSVPHVPEARAEKAEAERDALEIRVAEVLDRADKAEVEVGEIAKRGASFMRDVDVFACNLDRDNAAALRRLIAKHADHTTTDIGANTVSIAVDSYRVELERHKADWNIATARGLAIRAEAERDEVAMLSHQYRNDRDAILNDLRNLEVALVQRCAHSIGQTREAHHRAWNDVAALIVRHTPESEQ